jgi:hypothetical protein
VSGFGRNDVESILELMADGARVLAASWSDDDLGGGGDIDCAVQGLDPIWPLRLDPTMKLCQRLRYDVNASYWVIERDGAVVAIDAIEDPHGLGRYAFPSSMFFEQNGLVPPAGTRAAYLTVKRLKKGVKSDEAWNRIANVAREDRAYERILVTLLGGQTGHDLAQRVLAGSPPDPRLAARARRAAIRRRITSPIQLLTPLAQAARMIQRVRRPTGLLVTVAGPDGAGKSTLARSLPDACRGLFRRDAVFHWRPGLLPAPAALMGNPPGDATAPHSSQPHGRAVSLGRLLYFWTDFAIGSWARWLVLRARTGLVVVERGWWDILVDPRRYRLDIPPALVRTLGSLLPRSDLTLVCEASPNVLAARTSELDMTELSRQTLAWRTMAEQRGVRFVDAAARPAAVLAHARGHIVDHLEKRALARLAHGWTGLPRRSAPRWSLPRGPSAAARSSFLVYQPVSAARWAVWEASRRIASIGGMRLLPRGDAPPRAVRERLSGFVPRRGSVAVARANHQDRYFALIVASDGRPRLFVKVATSDEGAEALEQEAINIERFGPRLAPPLRAPAIVGRTDGVLAFRAERWRPRLRPWHLDEAVARACGASFREELHHDIGGTPIRPGHGDLAPWNLLRTSDAWVLVDWEDAREDLPPFYDVFHHLVQSHALLGRPRRRTVIRAVHGSGPHGGAVRGYARAAGLEMDGASEAFGAYLRRSAATLDPATLDGSIGLRIRRELAREWNDGA